MDAVVKIAAIVLVVVLFLYFLFLVNDGREAVEEQFREVYGTQNVVIDNIDKDHWPDVFRQVQFGLFVDGKRETGECQIEFFHPLSCEALTWPGGKENEAE